VNNVSGKQDYGVIEHYAATDTAVKLRLNFAWITIIKTAPCRSSSLPKPRSTDARQRGELCSSRERYDATATSTTNDLFGRHDPAWRNYGSRNAATDKEEFDRRNCTYENEAGPKNIGANPRTANPFTQASAVVRAQAVDEVEEFDEVEEEQTSKHLRTQSPETASGAAGEGTAG
jgi:hypothetical protein